MFVRRVAANQGADLPVLMDDPHALPVTDVHAPVHADGQTLGEGESGGGGGSSVSTEVLGSRNTPGSGTRHHLVVILHRGDVLQPEDPPDLGGRRLVVILLV